MKLNCFKCSFFLSGDSVPSEVPRLALPEDFFVNIAKTASAEVNRGLRFLQDVSCGGNLKQFLVVSCFSMPLLHFVVFIMM